MGLCQCAVGNWSTEMITEINTYEQTESFDGCTLMQGHAERAVLCVMSDNLQYLIIQYLVQSQGCWIEGILVHCYCVWPLILSVLIYTLSDLNFLRPRYENKRPFAQQVMVWFFFFPPGVWEDRNIQISVRYSRQGGGSVVVSEKSCSYAK